MKKIKVYEAAWLNNTLDRVMLVGAPIEDSKAIIKLCDEVEATAESYQKMVKNAIQKLDLKEGETMTLAEIENYLNEVLHDERMREIEITPFAISAEAKAAILSQSKVVRGELRTIEEIVKKEENN